jgi:hypothetical protein
MLGYALRNKKYQPKKMTKVEKQQVIELFHESGLCPHAFAVENGIAMSTFQGWLAKDALLREQGIDDFHEGGGRPKIFSPTVVKKIATKVIEREEEQDTPNKRELHRIIQEALQEERRLKNLAEVFIDFSRWSEWRLMKDIGASMQTVQLKTSARRKEEADIRNQYSWYCMVHAFGACISYHMNFNFDNTQYVVSKDENN